MPDLQELISRGRFLFSGAPKRLDVFKLINGKKSTKDIAIKTGRDLSSVLHDFEKLKDMELIREKVNNSGSIVKKGGAIVYEKVPLVKHVSVSYFQDVADTTKLTKRATVPRTKGAKPSAVHVPTEKEILDISNHGEDQIYEFKAPGTGAERVAREIAAYSHTKAGGYVFYGIEDDGTIVGSDISRQVFDQRVQNAVHHTIDPQPNIQIREVNVMGNKVIITITAPWDRKTFHHYTKTQRYLIRKGTNVFAIKPDELKKMSKGQYIV